MSVLLQLCVHFWIAPSASLSRNNPLNTNSAHKKRLFFAFWPDQQIKDEIMCKTKSIHLPQGRRIHIENLHLTLAFIGQVDAKSVSAYRERAKQSKREKFSLQLQGFGHFKRPRIFYLGVKTKPQQLTNMYDELHASLLPLGVQREQRAYIPHVSLFRDADTIPPQCPDICIDWHIDRFYLAESSYSSGRAVYTLVHEYKC